MILTGNGTKFGLQVRSTLFRFAAELKIEN